MAVSVQFHKHLPKTPYTLPTKHKAGSPARLESCVFPEKIYLRLISVLISSPKNFRGAGPAAGRPAYQRCLPDHQHGAKGDIFLADRSL